MRVGLVTSAYQPEVGGIQSYTAHLVAALVRGGCDVEVITQCPYGKAAEWSRNDRGSAVPILRFADQTHTRAFRVAPGLWRYLRRNGSRYDVLHAHSFHAFPAFAAAAACERPLVFSPHFHAVGHTAAAKVLHLPYNRLARRIFARSAAVVCDSAAEARLVRAYYPSFASRVRVVGTGINADETGRLEPFETQVPIVLTGGRLEAYKRFDRVVESFAYVSDHANLVITGTGPEEGHIRSRIEDLGLSERVQFLGRVDDLELRRWQRTAVVAVSLSTQEAFGLNLAEAAVAGASIVASDIPAHREVAEMARDKTGLVDVNASAAQVGAVLQDAIRRPRRAPGQFGFQTWDEVAGTVRTIYEEAVHGRD